MEDGGFKTVDASINSTHWKLMTEATQKVWRKIVTENDVSSKQLT